MGHGAGTPVRLLLFLALTITWSPLSCGPPKRTHLDRDTRTAPEAEVARTIASTWFGASETTKVSHYR